MKSLNILTFALTLLVALALASSASVKQDVVDIEKQTAAVADAYAKHDTVSTGEAQAKHE